MPETYLHLLRARVLLHVGHGLAGDAQQLAVQVPANVGHPAHLAADEVAHEPPFFDALGGNVPPLSGRRSTAPAESSHSSLRSTIPTTTNRKPTA